MELTFEVVRWGGDDGHHRYWLWRSGWRQLQPHVRLLKEKKRRAIEVAVETLNENALNNGIIDEMLDFENILE